jgi:prepilin-type N-terminal cleavage/methylation domain-containing protein
MKRPANELYEALAGQETCCGERGFTMIEVVITLAVVAILAAVLVPLISQNVQSARFARAGADVATLGKAVVQFRQDLGIWPVTKGGVQVWLLFSDTDNDNNGVPDTSSIPAGWSGISEARSSSMYYDLINNSNNYTPGPRSDGMPCWNGPYLSAARPDPWGNPYLINSQQLLPGNTGHVYVVSAGSGRSAQVDTPFNGSGPPPANSDDITFRLQ